LVDQDKKVRLDWANPASIGHQIDKLIVETNNSQHSVFIPPEEAERLELDMRALLRAKNTVSAIQVFGIFADVTEMDRLSAAHVVTSLIVEPSDEDQFANTVTHLAASLGHRRAKKSLMTEDRVSIGR